MRGHITFHKWDIFQNLKRVAPEALDRDLATPQGYSITQPTPINVGGMRSSSVEVQRAHSTTPSLPKEEAPPAESIPSPTTVDVDHTPLGLTDTPLERDAMPLPTKPEVEIPKGMPTSQATSPIRSVAQIVPTTGSMVKLTGPLIPSDQTEDERWYVLIVTALVRRLNLETNRVILGETVTTWAGEVASKNPQMAAVLPGLTRAKRVPPRCHHG